MSNSNASNLRCNAGIGFGGLAAVLHWKSSSRHSRVGIFSLFTVGEGLDGITGRRVVAVEISAIE
jgi:hypothetical protein